MIERTVEEMYRDDPTNEFLEVTYQNGDKEVMYFKDFASGAMIENIVRRAKKLAIKRLPGRRGQGHRPRRPARVDPPGVQGARGPAQHDEPRRLGEDLRQEGRADRLHPHPRQPRATAAAPPAAAPSSGSPPASTSSGVRASGLTETRDGRLVVICLVGGSLLLAAAVANAAMAGAADDTAENVRRALRRELSVVDDETLSAYPATATEIEGVAVSALVGSSGQVLGSAQPDGKGTEVVVAAQAGWAWQVRCIRAELRGDATVLTYVDPRPCGEP